MLFTINYPHFSIEHFWHHKTIGTKKDADTALKNETIYQFWLRSIPQGIKECLSWRANRSNLINIFIAQITIHIIIYLTLGTNAMIMFFMQGITTLMLLKWINYVEHYGAVRLKVNGQIEKVQPKHSWDSLSPLTNFSLFNLGYHSQHHMKPTAKFFDCPDKSESWNELPFGYSTMMMLALIPYFWKKNMNPRVDKIFS
jgi:alkane 1-monooxygenase